jgi:heme oxygenase
MSLKELTWENHKSAERKKFAGILMSGSIDPFLYYKYLTNQYYMYVTLESKLPLNKLEIADIRRAGLMRMDLLELELKYGFDKDKYPQADLLTRSTKDYLSYCESKEKPEDLIPHMYVRHFGDMYGGAMISKKVPGLGRMYTFKDKEGLKTKVRAILNDDMADEANACFEFAIRLFEELAE